MASRLATIRALYRGYVQIHGNDLPGLALGVGLLAGVVTLVMAVLP